MNFMERWRTRVTTCGAAAAVLFVTSMAPAMADNVRWKTIIGIIQAGNFVGGPAVTPQPTTPPPGAIVGGGQPWSTLGGQASVDLLSGRAEFEVRGLVLAGGNSIGTPDAITQVRGTLVCFIGTTTITFDTPLVPLSARGDAEFSGTIGPIATTCTPANVAFLVRIPAGRWIANGSVRTSSGN